MQTHFLLRCVHAQILPPSDGDDAAYLRNCRRGNAEYQCEVVLETDEETESDEKNLFEIPLGTNPSIRNAHVVRELVEYRRDRRYLNTHYRGSVFSPQIPFEADSGIWLSYYHKLELFTRMFPDNPLFVHGRVMLPISHSSVMRRTVYRMFMYNTPFTVFDITRRFAFDNLCLMP